MKVTVITVGRPARLLAEPIAEYEKRAARYWSLDTAEVREEKASSGRTDTQIKEAESKRLLERVPDGVELVLLTRVGEAWSSTRLARYLEDLAVSGHAGAAFVIGGALGFDDEIQRRATRRLSLSGATMPHDLARLVLMEQLYRAGTIMRGEPYHKGAE